MFHSGALAMNTMRIKWAAQLAHVREISLLGTADLAFWTQRMAAEELVPAPLDGRAQILIVATDAKFMGVRFRELSFSVRVLVPGEAIGTGAYLLHAFNSCRTFAFCERVFFATPYYHGDVRVSASLPARVELVRDDQVLFRAQMLAPGREAMRSGKEGWDGPVFLPAKRRGPGAGKLFFARIEGDTQAYPFLDSMDSLAISPAQDDRVLHALLDSGFAAREWAIRTDAMHAKSKTYKRAKVFAGPTNT
jgi:hypothetical protein